MKIVAIDHVQALKKEIEDKYNEGIFDAGICREYQNEFDFKDHNFLEEAKSIILVASPQPQTKVIFNLNNRQLPFFIPPTYDHSTDDQVTEILSGILEKKGFRLFRAGLPLKSLAVHSGLAQYGKNNIAYIPGLGSYFRLTAFYSDFPCESDSWHAHEMPEKCKTCKICYQLCPAGAISKDRFLLFAERCLTYHNESRKTFPEWIDSTWHHCLVGCMLCQSKCPLNKDCADWTDKKAEFSVEETNLILNGTSGTEYPAETMQKLKLTGILNYLEILPRNLSAVLDNTE